MDPQTAEEKILTYDQYVEAEQNWSEEPEESEEPMTDAEQGEDDGRSDGYDRGYEDGLAGKRTAHRGTAACGRREPLAGVS